jgi:hypothetical protein
MNKKYAAGSGIRRSVFVSSIAIIIVMLTGSPAYAAKSDSKKSKPKKETPVERDSSEGFDTRFAVLYGNKSLDKNDWAPVEKQTGFGVEAEFAKSDWPASAVVTYFTNDASGTENDTDIDEDEIADGDLKATGETTELGIGARKRLESDSEVTFFVEGGLVKVSAKVFRKVDQHGHAGFSVRFRVHNRILVRRRAQLSSQRCLQRRRDRAHLARRGHAF